MDVLEKEMRADDEEMQAGDAKAEKQASLAAEAEAEAGTGAGAESRAIPKAEKETRPPEAPPAPPTAVVEQGTGPVSPVPYPRLPHPTIIPHPPPTLTNLTLYPTQAARAAPLAGHQGKITPMQFLNALPLRLCILGCAFHGIVSGLGYLTYLVMTSDENNPGSNSSLSPPSSPPQPSNVSTSPSLLPPSELPIPHYLSSLAVGLIGGAMLCCLCCLGAVAEDSEMLLRHVEELERDDEKEPLFEGEEDATAVAVVTPAAVKAAEQALAEKLKMVEKAAEQAGQAEAVEEEAEVAATDEAAVVDVSRHGQSNKSVMQWTEEAEKAEKAKSAEMPEEFFDLSFGIYVLTIYPACFSLFILLGLTRDFAR